MRILITGATGLLGRMIAAKAVESGYEVDVLARNPESAKRALPLVSTIHQWSAKEPLEPSVLKDVSAVIHLAGEPIFGRWTSAKKKSILDSRVEGTRHLMNAVQEIPSVRTVVSASAIGYYGDGGDRFLHENSPPGKDFLAEVCKSWEREAKQASTSTRTAQLRLGVVLSSEGGLIGKLAPIFRNGLGGTIGDGKQWMSWIHIEDVAQLFLYALKTPAFQGAFNAVAPETVTNADFSYAFARRYGRKANFSVPKFAMKLAVGELADAITMSQKVDSSKARTAGFEFRYPTLTKALENLIP